MSTSRLVPYVEILVHPRRQFQKRPSPERSPSPTATIDPPSPNLSPRKRRKLRNEGSIEDNIFDTIKLKRRQVSPTASDFGTDAYKPPPSFNSCSKTLLESDQHEESEIEDPPSGYVCELPSDKYFYSLYEDDAVEDEGLVVDGETPQESDNDVPVRMLSDFSIYDLDSLEAVPLPELLKLEYLPKSRYGASGLVKVYLDEANDEYSNDSESEDASRNASAERVTLSRITTFSIHSPIEGKRALDSKIYIQTEFAWYILELPSEQYHPYFVPFWIQHRILHLLVVASLKNSDLTFKDFAENIEALDKSEDAITRAKDILGQDLNEWDVNSADTMAYLVSNLQELYTEYEIPISRVPAVKKIIGRTYESDVDVDGVSSSSRSSGGPSSRKKAPTHRSQKRPQSQRQPTNKERIKLRKKTYLTPIVNRIAEKLFDGSLEVAESMLYHSEEDIFSIKQRHHKGHHANPQKIIWGDQLADDEEVYDSVVVDGVKYCIGDVVMVEPGNEENSDEELTSATHTVNKYGNRWWFCQIRYFYQELVEGGRPRKMFHGQWFSHGSKTFLQETSHSRALYLLDSCDNNYISAIFKKCNFTILRPGDEEVLDDRSHSSNDFHCGLMYNDETAEYVDLPHDALSVDTDCGFKSCYACDLKAKEESSKEVFHSKKDEIVVFGETYHMHDFVYVQPNDTHWVFDIGQIKGFKTVKGKLQVELRLLGRYDDYILAQRQKDFNQLRRHELILDERRLFFTEDTVVRDGRIVDGRCHVRHLTEQRDIERWVEHDDHFYINQEGNIDELHPMDPEDFIDCEICYQEDKQVRQQKKRFLQKNSKLVGMELFSGAGGLGVGMDMSKFIETRYAVEFSPSAAKTYQRNHPEVQVYCQDSSELLKHAVDVMNNKNPSPLRSMGDGSVLPPLPDKNKNIDFIFGGPPCQSFSRANHSKRRDDIRSTMPCNMLSYVEHYEPNYFLLENVAGFLDHKFHNMRETDSGPVECDITHGMVKLVMRTLIALGYQVRYNLLQAGQYGVPQSRSRVIFWGAKRGLPLPEFPLPVYAFSQRRTTLPSGKKLVPPTRAKDPDGFHFVAPLKPITVDEAIGDLIPFDWKNPHEIISETRKDREELKKRGEAGICVFDASNARGEKSFDGLPGFPEGAPYAMVPQNRYQKWLRKGMEEEDLVTLHYTARWKERVVEATCNVPMRSHADHRDLPRALVADRMRASKNTFYGRMAADGHFKCAVTQLSPVTKNQWPLHPWQKRVVTIREAARAQGFPDHYIFESINDTAAKIIADQLRQIGNAVAVPFALALGKELGKAMVKAWEQKEREGSVGV